MNERTNIYSSWLIGLLLLFLQSFVSQKRNPSSRRFDRAVLPVATLTWILMLEWMKTGIGTLPAVSYFHLVYLWPDNASLSGDQIVI